MAKMTPIELAAVGRVAGLGDLYDARTDQFLHFSIFRNSIPNSAITSTHNRQTKLQYAFANTIEEKFNKMDISAGLKLSIMGGLFQLEGSGQFFKDTKKSAKSAKASVINSISTEYERISITDDTIRSIMDLDVLKETDATHVVVGIQWGGYVFVSVEDTNIEDKDQLKVQGNLKAKLTAMAGKISFDGNSNIDANENEKSELSKFNFEIFGDILPDKIPQNVLDALNFMKNATIALQKANEGKGKEIKYTLIPINSLRKVMKIEFDINALMNQVDDATVQQCVRIFDEMNKNEQKINDLVDMVKLHDQYLPTNKVKELSKLQFDYQIYQVQIKKQLSDNLILVRSGKETIGKFTEIIEQSIKHPSSWFNIEIQFNKLSIELRQEISFLKYLLKLEVILLVKDYPFDMFLHEYPKNDVYILCYSEPNSKNIGNPMKIFLKMLDSKSYNKITDIFAAVNNTNNGLDNQSKLIFFRNMELQTENFAENYSVSVPNDTKLWSISFMQDKLKSLIENPAIPVGFIYTQLMDQYTPLELWPSFTWLDVTDKYAGLFFRALGMGSEPFGVIQEENQFCISEVNLRGRAFDWKGKDEHTYKEFLQKSGNVNVFGTVDRYPLALDLMEITTIGEEVWPRNTGIKIWERVE